MYKKPQCSSWDELKPLIQKVEDKAGKEFDSLVSKFNIDTKKNKEWAGGYYTACKECNKLERSIRALKIWRWILIIPLLIPLIFPFILMTKGYKKKQPILEEKIKYRDQTKKELDKQLNGFFETLSYEFAYQDIINKAWEDIKLDLYLNKKENMNWEYDYKSFMPKDSCATSLVSGRLFEHPFILMNRYDQTWYPHTYTGTAPVTYTVTVDGKTQTRFDVVVATVTLPAPAWNMLPLFLYKTSKPLDLSFSNNISTRQAKKAIKKMEYQAMDNPQFDKIFPATRNNEIEYRVVFTPIAQEGFVDLFKHLKYSITKEKELTEITCGNELVDNVFQDDFNYDLEVWKEKYCNWCTRLVSLLAGYSLPIANMPVYYQMSYKDHNSTSSPSRLQFEDLAYWVCDMFNLWGNFDTRAIFEPLEYRTITIDGTKFNLVEVGCNYFYPRHRVQVEIRYAHGKTVPVPVEVIDYLPRQKSLYIFQSPTFNTYRKEIVSDSNWAFHAGQLIFWSFSSNYKQIEAQLKEIKKEFKQK